MTRVLLAGESWISQATHFKGFDSFTSVTFHTAADVFLAALAEHGIDATQLYAHDVPDRFPFELAELEEYDVIVLSDIGANSFLLPQDTWISGASRPDRLRMLATWVRQGGGLMMAGGYLSFQGFQARANYARSALADVLPVVMADVDDRVEASEGAQPRLVLPGHPVGQAWAPEPPVLLGYNRVQAKPDAQLIATVDDDPLIVTAEVGEGRSLVWTSDIGPHWCPVEFCRWPGFASLMAGMVQWLGKAS